jgi:hypothetical protein
MERDDRQHDQPKNIPWNIGIKRPDKAVVAMRLLFLFRRCLQHGGLLADVLNVRSASSRVVQSLKKSPAGGPAGLEKKEGGMVEQRIVRENVNRRNVQKLRGVMPVLHSSLRNRPVRVAIEVV